MAAFLILFQSLAVAESAPAPVASTAREGVVLKTNLNFWSSSFVGPGLQFSPLRNEMLGPWQIRYSWKSDVLVLGNRKYSPQDPRFLKSGTKCFRQNGTGGDEKSFATFCRGQKNPGSAVFTLNGQVVSPQGLIALTEGEPLKIEIHWPTGHSVLISLQSPEERSADIQRRASKDFQWTTVVPEKAGAGATASKEAYFSEATLPRRLITKSQVYATDPVFLVDTGLDQMQRQRLLTGFQKIPRVRSALWSDRVLGTYKNELQFKTRGGFSVDGNQSQQWRIANLPNGLSEVEIEAQGERYQTEVWALKNSEISGQLSGFVLNTDSLLLTGEGTLVHFFENPFGNQFEDWNTHRWGARLRYYGAMTTLKGFQPGDAINMSFASAEARMLLRPGLWNLDSVYGALVSFNQFDLFESSQNYLGVGLFWGRSMPHGIDRWFEKLSWFRYPKYVDLDVSILQPATQDKGASLSLVANFHGKMFIGNDWFISGGVGFFQIRASSKRQLAAAVGTLGLGLMF